MRKNHTLPKKVNMTTGRKRNKPEYNIRNKTVISNGNDNPARVPWSLFPSYEYGVCICKNIRIKKKPLLL